MLHTRPLSFVAVALVAGLAWANPAHAQVKPFKITGVGLGTQGLPLPGEPPRPPLESGHRCSPTGWQRETRSNQN